MKKAKTFDCVKMKDDIQMVMPVVMHMALASNGHLITAHCFF